MISMRLPCALPAGPIPLGDREVCANTVTVVLNTDDDDDGRRSSAAIPG